MILPILSVKDVDASVAFYTEKLGFAHSFSMPGEDGKTVFAFVNLGEAVVIGLSLDPALANRGAGVDLMLYLPDDKDLDQHYQGVRSKGVAVAEQIGDRYWGDRTYALHDPDGYRLTFARTVKQMSPEEVMAMQQGGGARGS